MVASGTVRVLAFCFLVASCFAQQLPQHSQPAQAGAIEKVILEVISSMPVPSLPTESVTRPVLCFPDGGILLRLAMPDTGVEDPVSVSSDGKTVIRFGKEKINDVPDPSLLSIFVSDSELYALALGRIPLGYQSTWRKPNGEVETHPASKSSPFVARFRRDGTYAGAVPLDLSFKPLHLGVFENGDFLIAGADESTSEPRVAILGSNGQFRRSVELKGDVHAQEEFGESGKEKDPNALPRFKPGKDVPQSLRRVVFASQIVKDGPNLLLFRPLKGPVFSTSPSGEVQVHKLKVEGDYKLFTIKTTGNDWIVELTQELADGTERFVTYAFDPETGAPRREYFFPTDFAFGLACIDRDEFTFINTNYETKALTVLKLATAALPKSE
jgi:hypothetical protein